MSEVALERPDLRAVSSIDEECSEAGALLLPMGAGEGDRRVCRSLQSGAVKVRTTRLPAWILKQIGHSHILSLTQYRREKTGLLVEAMAETEAVTYPPHQKLIWRRNLYSLVLLYLPSSNARSRSFFTLSTKAR
jgi:hypothetical protein